MTNLNPQNARLKKRPKMIDLNPSNNKWQIWIALDCEQKTIRVELDCEGGKKAMTRYHP
jgi:hypothetical protein